MKLLGHKYVKDIVSKLVIRLERIYDVFCEVLKLRNVKGALMNFAISSY